MINLDVRKQINRLLDEADEKQLGAVLEVLQPTSSRYSAEDIASFYKRLNQFEANGSKGFTVEESHSFIRNKFKEDGA